VSIHLGTLVEISYDKEKESAEGTSDGIEKASLSKPSFGCNIHKHLFS
jgi:hypothetical protein